MTDSSEPRGPMPVNRAQLMRDLVSYLDCTHYFLSNLLADSDEHPGLDFSTIANIVMEGDDLTSRFARIVADVLAKDAE